MQARRDPFFFQDLPGRKRECPDIARAARDTVLPPIYTRSPDKFAPPRPAALTERAGRPTVEKLVKGSRAAGSLARPILRSRRASRAKPRRGGSRRSFRNLVRAAVTPVLAEKYPRNAFSLRERDTNPPREVLARRFIILKPFTARARALPPVENKKIIAERRRRAVAQAPFKLPLRKMRQVPRNLNDSVYSCEWSGEVSARELFQSHTFVFNKCVWIGLSADDCSRLRDLSLRTKAISAYL